MIFTLTLKGYTKSQSFSAYKQFSFQELTKVKRRKRKGTEEIAWDTFYSFHDLYFFGYINLRKKSYP